MISIGVRGFKDLNNKTNGSSRSRIKSTKWKFHQIGLTAEEKNSEFRSIGTETNQNKGQKKLKKLIGALVPYGTIIITGI